LWLLSDFQQIDLAKLKTAIPASRVNRVNVMQVTDIFDKQLPKSGQLPVKHLSQQSVIDTEQQSARQAHETMFLAKQHSLAALAHYFSGQLITISNQEFTWQDVTQWPL
jgi:hypothetical protein